jgi:hypothetical protein
LVKTKAAFVEGLRLAPAANILLRGSREDTIPQVLIRLGDGIYSEKGMAIPEDTTLVVDMVGPREFSLKSRNR